jgi:hypothetical protein
MIAKELPKKLSKVKLSLEANQVLVPIVPNTTKLNSVHLAIRQIAVFLTQNIYKMIVKIQIFFFFLLDHILFVQQNLLSLSFLWSAQPLSSGCSLGRFLQTTCGTSMVTLHNKWYFNGHFTQQCLHGTAKQSG